MNLIYMGLIVILNLTVIKSAPFLSKNSLDNFSEITNDIVEINTANEEELLNDPIFDLSAYGSSLYMLPDFNNTGRLIKDYTPNDFLVNPEEMGPYVEGDILWPQQEITFRNAITSKSFRWSGAIVPYEIVGDFRPDELLVIHNAMRNYHQHTCVRFIPRSTEMDYISIGNTASGCWSSIGRMGGKQDVNLQSPGCLKKPGTAMHELMHALGFLHEQNREERDAFVYIRYENIKQTAYGNFQKVSPTVAFGIPYDYASVMHYSAKAFSQNGLPTIEAKDPSGNHKMGQRNGFSPLDIEKINRMYNCFDGDSESEEKLKKPQKDDLVRKK